MFSLVVQIACVFWSSVLPLSFAHCWSLFGCSFFCDLGKANVRTAFTVLDVFSQQLCSALVPIYCSLCDLHLLDMKCCPVPNCFGLFLWDPLHHFPLQQRNLFFNPLLVLRYLMVVFVLAPWWSSISLGGFLCPWKTLRQATMGPWKTLRQALDSFYEIFCLFVALLQLPMVKDVRS